MKLASDWKSKIAAATENRFAAFGLLYFIASDRFGSIVDENELHSLLDAVGLNGQALLLSPAICTVDKSTGTFLSDVAKSVRNLIQRGETVPAVRHICKLKLTDKFPPAPLLDEYLEHAKNYITMMLNKRDKYNEANKKAIDREEAALRAVMECIKDCNLESEYHIIILSSKIAERVGTLEKMAKSDGLKLEQSKKHKNNNVAPRCPPITG